MRKTAIFPFVILCSLFLGLAHETTAHAQAKGFTLERYEPTMAGEWSFWVDHPIYNKVFGFAAGLTLDYGHQPLVFGLRDDSGFKKQYTVIDHELVGHIDLALSFFDRIAFSLGMPITLFEGGTTTAGVSPGSVAAGDPRIGVMGRLYGQSMSDPFSLHVGLQVWIPRGSGSVHMGDSGVRVAPKLVMGGLSHRVMWSFTAAYEYRPKATIGNLPTEAGNNIGPEFQLGAAIAYADMKRNFMIGPEAMMATVVTGSHAFKTDYTSLEVLLGVQYKVAKQLLIGAAGGVGILREPGTPDGRVILRLAYAPETTPCCCKEPGDRDHDGIIDILDACPDVPGVATDSLKTNGCPDKDSDGFVDKVDLCPEVPAGLRPDPAKPGCPIVDTDGDGILDKEDACPTVPGVRTKDPKTNGCPPPKDTDGDGILDSEDKCPTVPVGSYPDPDKLGCPLVDTDGDGVFDHEDACPTVPGIRTKDPKTNGCLPIKDSDNDGIPDSEDKCPNMPPGPDPHPTMLGCPNIAKHEIIVEPVFFATDKDVILGASAPALQHVADVLAANPIIKRVSIIGHTDNKGGPAFNKDLSRRRANNVMTWLIQHGVAASRLESHGLGQSKPVASNATEEGRAKNRRVLFIILDPKSFKQQ